MPQSSRLSAPLRKCGEASLIDPGLNVAVSDAFEIHHRRCNVPVTHPLLQCADVDSVLEVSRGICVAEFVEEPTTTVRAPSAQRLTFTSPSSSLWVTTQ